MTRTTLALDVGGSHVAAGLVSGGEVHRLCELRREPAAPLRDMNVELAAIESALADRGVVPAAVAVAVAGIVDPANRSLVRSENLRLDDNDLAAALESRFRAPAFVETDVACAAAGEVAGRPALAVGTVLYVAVGTGIGSAVVVDGRLVPGRERGANRFGHVVVEPGGRACYCGHGGCVCQYAAGSALHGPRSDDTATPEVMLARALASTCQVLAPHTVVLSGGAVESGALAFDQVVAAIPRYLDTWMLPRVVAGSVAHAHLVGAVLLADRAQHERKDVSG